MVLSAQGSKDFGRAGPGEERVQWEELRSLTIMQRDHLNRELGLHPWSTWQGIGFRRSRAAAVSEADGAERLHCGSLRALTLSRLPNSKVNRHSFIPPPGARRKSHA